MSNIPSFSEEFGYTEHLLRMQLNAPSLKISELSDFKLKPIITQFENFIKNHNPVNVVDAFIPVSEISQDVSNVSRYGIRVSPKDGFAFTLNDIKINKSGENVLYHAQIALGAVYNYQDMKAPLDSIQYISTPPTSENLPSGYDSLRIGNNKFVVFHQNQVKNLHLVKFTWDPKFEKVNPSRNVCDICGKPDAKLYCTNDHLKLCQKCDASQHKSQETKNHKREPLETSLSQNQKCPEHQDHPVQYYCNKCKLPVCVDCKVKGSHSNREFLKHKLTPIDEAFKNCVKEHQDESDFITKRHQILDNEIKNKDAELQQIAKNLKETEDEIMRMAMKAIHDARNQSNQSANLVKSAKLELIRKKDELERQKNLVKGAIDEGEPLYVLQTVKDDELYTNFVKENKDLPLKIEGIANLDVFGQIQVKPQAVPAKLNNSSLVQNREINEFDSDQNAEEDEEEIEDLPHISSLAKIAERKLKKFQEMNTKFDFVPFQDSQILTNDELRNRLYLCLPFKAVPEPHILFSSFIHGMTMKSLHENVDNVGITCVLIKFGKNIFGGFAGTKWTPDGNPKREKSSTFLFQLTKDAYIPYGGQKEDTFYTVSTENYISFGGEDLKISGKSLEECSSAIENSFGVGLKYGSKAAKEFLAGKHQFKPDAIEIWGFFSPN